MDILSLTPSLEDLWSSGALLWGLLWTGVVASIGIASPRAALLLATFGLTYLAKWSWGRMQLMWGENWARIDASFNYILKDEHGQYKMFIFPWELDGKIQK